MRIDHDGNVWVTDIGNHLVLKFDSQGRLLLSLGRKGRAGDGPDQFDRPTHVAVAATGAFYVTDGYGNARVLKFDRTGKLLKQWGTKASAGEFSLPHAVCLDAKGRVYVGDRENNRVQVFDGEGKFLDQWNESGAPFGLFLAGERLFVADGRANLGPGPRGGRDVAWSLRREGDRGGPAPTAAHAVAPRLARERVRRRGDHKRIQKFTAAKE